EILKNITPRYIVISGPTGVGKTSIMRVLKERIENKGFSVKICCESILKGSEYLLEYKENDIQKFEYALLNQYHKRRIEMENLKEDFIIVDREVFDGDVYKEIYEFDKNIIKNEHVEFNNLIMVFLILCNENNLERNYNSRKVNERKYSLAECKNILKVYRDKFKNNICNDAIIINNNNSYFLNNLIEKKMDLNQMFNDILLKYQNIFNIDKKHDPKIIIITGPIGAGKTKLSNFLAEYLQSINKKVLLSEEMSLILEKELSIYYKLLDENPDDQSIVFWFQGLLIGEYKKYYEKCNFENYDYIILDRSHLDTIFFTFNGIKDVINISVTKEISLKRIFERDRKLRNDKEYDFSEKDVNEKYYESMYNSYKVYIDKVYPSYYSFDNNENLSDDIL
ncbi:2981_t:CDS:2, partial [Cetraspora pellucida]